MGDSLSQYIKEQGEKFGDESDKVGDKRKDDEKIK